MLGQQNMCQTKLQDHANQTIWRIWGLFYDFLLYLSYNSMKKTSIAMKWE
jgi:hypothetical protein